MSRTLTLLGLVSLFHVTTITEIAAQPDTVWATTPDCGLEMKLVDSVSVDYLPIEHRHSRPHPFSIYPLIIEWADADGCRPCFSPDWTLFSPERIWVMTCEWWVPYPSEWLLTDHDIDRVVNATNFDGNLNEVPDWIEFDYNADGYCNLSDLSWFGVDYGDGQRWDLSDFTVMGSIYNTRRNDD